MKSSKIINLHTLGGSTEDKVQNYIPIDFAENVAVRVLILDNNRVEIRRIYDILDSDIKLKEYYSSVDELPEELRRNIAVLSLVEVDEAVESIGLRFSENGYWVAVRRSYVL